MSRLGSSVIHALLAGVSIPILTQSLTYGVTRISDDDVQYALERVSASESRGVKFRSARDGRAQFILNVRRSASEIEIHCAWDDVVIVRSGYGVLQYGQSIRGEQSYPGQEWRASRIEKPVETVAGPGDIIRIPAGVAHSVRPLGDAPVVYVIAKNAASKPSRSGVCKPRRAGPRAR